jgi:hypothetical protein
VSTLAPPSSGTGPLAGRRKVLRKVVVTSTIGGVTYLATFLAGQSQISAVMLSSYVGGVVLVVQFLVDFEIRLASVETGQVRQAVDLRQLVDDRFANVSSATELFGQVEASQLRDHVVRLARNSIRIRSDRQLVVDLAQHQIDQVSIFLRQLGTGMETVYEGEDRDWLLALTRGATKSIDATSQGSTGMDGRFIDEGLWMTELGQRYLEAQVAALREGVAIRRVFVLEKAELANDLDFRTLIYDRQRDLGIQVRVADLSVTGVGLTFLSDLILFDEVIAYESTTSTLSKSAPMFVKTTLVLDAVRVQQRVARFDNLWESAHELD